MGLSGAARVVGWRGEDVPAAGDEVLGVESEGRAREVVTWRGQQLLAMQVSWYLS